MPGKNTAVRSLHDLGLAAWFGGSLMGAVSIEGAADTVSGLDDRVQIADAGWSRWQPYDAVAIAAHLAGGLGLLLANQGRVATQPGARATTALKTALTGVALGLSVHNKRRGKQVARHRRPHDQRRLRWGQCALPVATGALVVLAAEQGEQQRPTSLLRAQASRLPSLPTRADLPRPHVA